MVMDDGLTLDGGHTVQHIDRVLQKCTLETYMTQCHPRKFNKKRKSITTIYSLIFPLLFCIC